MRTAILVVAIVAFGLVAAPEAVAAPEDPVCVAAPCTNDPVEKVHYYANAVICFVGGQLGLNCA